MNRAHPHKGKWSKQKYKLLAWTSLLVCISYLSVACMIGIRIPGLQLDNYQVLTAHEDIENGFSLSVEGGYIKQVGHQFVVRAYSPHLKLRLSGHLISFPIEIENIHPDAVLITGQNKVEIQEEKQNLNRGLIVNGKLELPLSLQWKFPQKTHYRFMALGDTGGGKELEWALIRAKQLNADFVVHLGDMFYSPQDVYSAFNTIQNSPVPVFNIYGNHDYYNDGKYPLKNTFNKNFSPSNFQFELLDKTFISLDTSSHIFPYHKGMRGKFLKPLIEQIKSSEHQALLFTHQPIANTMYHDIPELEHGITGFEGAWLEQKLLPVRHLTVIAGHVHQSLQVTDALLPTYVAGEGIAHRDLIANQSVSKVLIGDIYEGQLTYFSWELNNMPRAYQTSLKSQFILDQHIQNLAMSDNEADKPDNASTN